MMANCAACGGTRKLHLMRSWFTSDGAYAADCWYCDAQGKVTCKPDADFVRRQKDRRLATAKQRKVANDA